MPQRLPTFPTARSAVVECGGLTPPFPEKERNDAAITLWCRRSDSILTFRGSGVTLFQLPAPTSLLHLWRQSLGSARYEAEPRNEGLRRAAALHAWRAGRVSTFPTARSAVVECGGLTPPFPAFVRRDEPIGVRAARRKAAPGRSTPCVALGARIDIRVAIPGRRRARSSNSSRLRPLSSLLPFPSSASRAFSSRSCPASAWGPPSAR